MRRLAVAAGALVAVLALLGGGVLGLSELGEVVVITTGSGEDRGTTRVWVVDSDGRPWLRAGQPENRWLARLRTHPELEMERGGTVGRYRAVLVETPEARERLNALFAEKYGIADRLIGVLRDSSRVTPIRLDPAEP